MARFTCPVAMSTAARRGETRSVAAASSVAVVFARIFSSIVAKAAAELAA